MSDRLDFPLRFEYLTPSDNMTYAEAVEYLDTFVNYERTPPDRTQRAAYDLSRVALLARRLGDPQRETPCIHVAGTKGKGSTCAFADAILRAARLRVGLYTSPHLIDFRERIRINGEAIGEKQFAALMDECRPVLDELRQAPEGTRRPTYFEALTHLAFLYFARSKVDVAVLEVGMGGRLDATNIVTPVVCGITHVSLDHTAILGETLGLIAREKAGILKPGIPAVIGAQELEAESAIGDVAARVGAPLEWVGRQLRVDVEQRAPEAGRRLPRIAAKLSEASGAWAVSADLGLSGAFQAQNWAIAVRMAQRFHEAAQGGPLPLNAIRSGSRKVRWQGRLEEFPQPLTRPSLILDGAHNEASLRKVLGELKAVAEGAPLIVLFGCARDKDVHSMLSVLRDLADAVVFTEIGKPRTCAATALGQAWEAQSGKVAQCRIDPLDGLDLARTIAASTPERGRGIVVATGSLYLVGALKAAFLRTPPF